MNRIYRWMLIALVSFTTACSNEGKLLKKEEVGNDWPLTVDECYVNCIDEFAIVITVGNKTYAVNEAARETGKYEDITEITRNDPNYPGQKVKMKLSDIEFEGLKICR